MLAAVLPAACSTSEERMPGACTQGADAVRGALAVAPGAVRLDGVRLSDCLTEGSDADDVQVVGAAFLDVAARLADAARRRPRGAAAVRLGYLLGAARRGAAHTQGIHTELVRRLEQELTMVDTRTAAFRRGERAGRTLG